MGCDDLVRRKVDWTEASHDELCQTLQMGFALVRRDGQFGTNTHLVRLSDPCITVCRWKTAPGWQFVPWAYVICRECWENVGPDWQPPLAPEEADEV